MTEHELRRPRCRATVYDKYSEESRPCMRRVGLVDHASLHNVYCWQHALIAGQIMTGLGKMQGARR
jgi:hypothetical protein